MVALPEEIRRRILLVDDDLGVLLSLKAVLEFSGFEVDSASSAAEARSRLQSSRYHMVITDMKMEEDREGFQVIEGARESGYDPAIAILTAYPVEESQWREEGAHCMLVKPVGPYRRSVASDRGVTGAARTPQAPPAFFELRSCLAWDETVGSRMVIFQKHQYEAGEHHFTSRSNSASIFLNA